MNPELTKQFESLRRCCRFTSDWLAWWLTSNATYSGEKSWLILPEGVDSAEGRICVVAHIDTVHDGTRKGFVDRTFLKSGTLATKRTETQKVERSTPWQKKGRPSKTTKISYYRLLRNTQKWECVITKRGEWRRKDADDVWTFWKGWGDDIGTVIYTFSTMCGKVYLREAIKIVSNPKNAPGSKAKKDMADVRICEEDGYWQEEVIEPKKYRKALILYDQKRRVFWSPDGLGGDDRVGVWAAFQMLNQAPDAVKPVLLFCDLEERGGQGAREACTVFKDHLSKVNSFIEFDRKGQNDAVYYNNEPKNWRKVWRGVGFEDSHGSYSDVSTLGKEFRLCTVNLSCGYIAQHTKQEHAFKTVAEENVKKALEVFPDLLERKRWDNHIASRVVTYADRRSGRNPSVGASVIGASHQMGFGGMDDYDYNDRYYHGTVSRREEKDKEEKKVEEKGTEEESISTWPNASEIITRRVARGHDEIKVVNEMVFNGEISPEEYDRYYRAACGANRTSKFYRGTIGSREGGYDDSGALWVRFREWDYKKQEQVELKEPVVWCSNLRTTKIFHGFYEGNEYPTNACGENDCIRCNFRFLYMKEQEEKEDDKSNGKSNGKDTGFTAQMGHVLTTTLFEDVTIYYCGVCDHWFNETYAGVHCGDTCPLCNTKSKLRFDAEDAAKIKEVSQ